jgi:hypothetical protein
LTPSTLDVSVYNGLCSYYSEYIQRHTDWEYQAMPMKRPALGVDVYFERVIDARTDITSELLAVYDTDDMIEHVH